MHRADAPAPAVNSSIRLENLSRESQLLLRGKVFVKFLHVRVVHIVALRGLIYAGNTVQIPGDQLPAEEERVIRPLRQIVIADTEVPGIIKAALPVEADVFMAAAFSNE